MDIMKRIIRLKEDASISESDKDFLIAEVDDAINEALCELGFADSVDIVKED